MGDKASFMDAYESLLAQYREVLTELADARADVETLASENSDLRNEIKTRSVPTDESWAIAREYVRDLEERLRNEGYSQRDLDSILDQIKGQHDYMLHLETERSNGYVIEGA